MQGFLEFVGGVTLSAGLCAALWGVSWIVIEFLSLRRKHEKLSNHQHDDYGRMWELHNKLSDRIYKLEALAIAKNNEQSGKGS